MHFPYIVCDFFFSLKFIRYIFQDSFPWVLDSPPAGHSTPHDPMWCVMGAPTPPTTPTSSMNAEDGSMELCRQLSFSDSWETEGPAGLDGYSDISSMEPSYWEIDLPVSIIKNRYLHEFFEKKIDSCY